MAAMEATRALLVARPDSPACAMAQRLVEAAALQILDQAQTATEALTMTLALQPDVLLLDPGLRPVNAAELATSLHDPAPRLVWLAHDVVRRCVAAGDAQRVNATLLALPRRRMGVEVSQLLVLEHGLITRLDLADVRWMELPDPRRASVLLHGFREQHMLQRRFAELLDDLPPGRLLRCQTRVAVAPAYVLEALPHDNKRATLLLDNGTRLTCGPQYWPALEEALRQRATPVAPTDRPFTPSRWSAPWRLDSEAADSTGSSSEPNHPG
ncbi:DNA-binding LytR/AlgR family response regulator [Roseateles asaccharophilus]